MKHIAASYTVNSSNQLTADSNASYTYDNNGNTLTKTIGTDVTTYGWDLENRLTSVQLPNGGGTVNYKYDPFGRRVYRSGPSGTTIWNYDAANIVQELDGSGTVRATYAHGAAIDEPLAMLRGASTLYYEQDGLGSVISLTDSNGVIAESYEYDSYGKLLTGGTTVANPFRYTGREWDGETGLYYYRARYYQISVGRFLNEDPTRFTSGINFAEYVDNNPVNYSDPSGLQTAPVLTPPPQLTVIIGGGGGALWSSGTLATGGAVALAGVAGWVTGRAIGHIPIGKGRTVDEAVTDFFAKIWIKPDPTPEVRPRPVSRTKPCKNKGDDDDCGREWEDARRFCAEVMAIPRNSPIWPDYIHIWGGSYQKCVMGQVSERCGGNRVD